MRGGIIYHLKQHFWQEHLRAAAAQSHLGSIHLLPKSSWQHLIHGGLGQLHHEGVLEQVQRLGLLDDLQPSPKGELMVTED